MLAMLIGMAGTGCRRSNPAYRWPIDAARGPDRGADSPASIDARIDAPIDAHVDAAIDKVSVDTLPDLGSLELGGPELGYRDAGQEVADAGIVDAAQDQRPDGGTLPWIGRMWLISLATRVEFSSPGMPRMPRLMPRRG